MNFNPQSSNNYGYNTQYLFYNLQPIMFGNGKIIRLEFLKDTQGNEALRIRMATSYGCEKVTQICSDGSSITRSCVSGTITKDSGPPFCYLQCTPCTPT